MEQIGGSSQRMEEDQAVVVGERVRLSRSIREDLQVVSGSTAVGRRWWCPNAIVGIRGVVIEGGRLSEERERGDGKGRASDRCSIYCGRIGIGSSQIRCWLRGGKGESLEWEVAGWCHEAAGSGAMWTKL
jgi:hypothetical protein